MFISWVLGKDPREKIISGSYNEILSQSFSRTIRDNIMTEKLDPDITVFSDIFPGVKIQRGNSAANHWSLEGQFNNYLSTSPGGSSTGFGCHWLVLDDLIKSAEEAMNEAALEKTWGWLASTLISRIEAGGKIVVCATFWCAFALCFSKFAFLFCFR